ncbi:hypothetical protein, partial [Halorientalis sp.]|uniref:hypothetical protein n=1 Tax=Halorientalis sp. TaxID=1931229 RepID=UPI002626B03F
MPPNPLSLRSLVVIVTVERDGALARANRAATELFGSATDEAPFADVIGHDRTALANRETVE